MTLSPPRILIAGGGTGGHAVPALAIAEAILRREPRSEIRFLGTQRGVESRLVATAGFRFETISVIALRRRIHPDLIRFPLILLKGFMDSMRSILSFKPDAVVCTGGYASGPVGIAAIAAGRPLILHESNVLPGITVRTLSHGSRVVFLGTERASRLVGGRERVAVGSPLREAALKGDAKKRAPEDGPHSLLIIGGSQGSRAINLAVESALPELMKLNVRIVWQTGYLDIERVEEAAKAWRGRITVAPFIDDVSSAYLNANLAVTRAGAMTIAELNQFGLPSILIPLATSSENHQELNAREGERAGWAKMILQRNLDGRILTDTIAALIGEPARLKAMQERSRSLAVPDAADKIVDFLVERGILKVQQRVRAR